MPRNGGKRPMRLLMGLAAAILLASTAQAAELPADRVGLPSFEFREHKAGEELATAYPRNRGILSPCRDGGGDRTLVYCYDRGSGFGGAINGYIQNVTVPSLKYFYYEGKLMTVEMLFGADDYEAILQMLVGRYGPVAVQDTQAVQNSLGVQYANRMALWRFAEGNLQIQERYELANQSKLVFTDTAGMARFNEAVAKMQQDAGRSAF